MKDSRKDSKGRVLKDSESQRKDGSYEYKGADGRRHSVYAGTLKELREKRKQAEKNVEDGILFVNQNILLNDVFDIYFSGKTELKESTRSNYKYMYDKFVRMKFGMRKISLIKYSDIREFYNYLINDLSFKPNSLEIIHYDGICGHSEDRGPRSHLPRNGRAGASVGRRFLVWDKPAGGR